MKIFSKPNLVDNWKCPICNTNEERPVILVGIDGTEEGSIIQADQFHVHCIELTYFNSIGVIGMKFNLTKQDGIDEKKT